MAVRHMSICQYSPATPSAELEVSIRRCIDAAHRHWKQRSLWKSSVAMLAYIPTTSYACYFKRLIQVDLFDSQGNIVLLYVASLSYKLTCLTLQETLYYCMLLRFHTSWLVWRSRKHCTAVCCFAFINKIVWTKTTDAMQSHLPSLPTAAVSVNLHFYIKKLVANSEEKDESEQRTRIISLEQLFLAGVAQRYGVRLLSRRTSVRFCFGYPFSSEKLRFVDTVFLWKNTTLKWLSLLPLLMQEPFWWWQCSIRYRLYPLPPPPGISAKVTTHSTTTQHVNSALLSPRRHVTVSALLLTLNSHLELKKKKKKGFLFVLFFKWVNMAGRRSPTGLWSWKTVIESMLGTKLKDSQRWETSWKTVTVVKQAGRLSTWGTKLEDCHRWETSWKTVNVGNQAGRLSPLGTKLEDCQRWEPSWKTVNVGKQAGRQSTLGTTRPRSLCRGQRRSTKGDGVQRSNDSVSA